MHLDRYPLKAYDDNKRFEFISKGPKGKIKKVVKFQKMNKNVYNLAFGDYDKKERLIDSKIRSNNGDRDKVLATVAYSVIQFFIHDVHATVRIIGETTARTRLYQMGINKYLAEINLLYQVEGSINGAWKTFSLIKTMKCFF